MRVAHTHSDEIHQLRAEIKRLTRERDAEASTVEQFRREWERLRALLVRYQAANYIPEDCDLYAETKAALNPISP